MHLRPSRRYLLPSCNFCPLSRSGGLWSEVITATAGRPSRKYMRIYKNILRWSLNSRTSTTSRLSPSFEAFRKSTRHVHRLYRLRKREAIRHLKAALLEIWYMITILSMRAPALIPEGFYRHDARFQATVEARRRGHYSHSAGLPQSAGH